MVTITNARLASSRRLLLGVSISVALMGLASSAFAQDAWKLHIGLGRTVLLGDGWANQAVWDRETDLVWEQSPSGLAFTWDQAEDRCNSLVIGNRMGWRVPTLQELLSVLDLSQGSHLPPNNKYAFPFPIPPNEAIWSSTSTDPCRSSCSAWEMDIGGNVLPTQPKGSLSHAWCVRFRQGVDSQ